MTGANATGTGATGAGTTSANATASSVHDSTAPDDAASAADASSGWQLWDKDVIPFVRDLLFVLAIFAYVIGFAHHAAKMSAFGVDLQLADQPLDSLFNWAAESIAGGWAGFAIILVLVALLLLLAGYLKDRLKDSKLCRPIVYGVATLAVLTGLTLTFAWSSHEGRCSAARFANGQEPKTSLTMFMNASAQVPVLTANPQAPPPVYILGETNDMYQLLVTQPSPTGSEPSMLSIAVPRSLVQSIEFRTFGQSAQPAAATGSGSPGLPEGIPTPDALQSGAGASAARAVSNAPSVSSCWLLDNIAGA